MLASSKGRSWSHLAVDRAEFLHRVFSSSLWLLSASYFVSCSVGRETVEMTWKSFQAGDADREAHFDLTTGEALFPGLLLSAYR